VVMVDTSSLTCGHHHIAVVCGEVKEILAVSRHQHDISGSR